MNEFEIAVVNEPSVFEPLKFFCTYIFNPFFFSSFSIISNMSICKCNLKLFEPFNEHCHQRNCKPHIRYSDQFPHFSLI